MKEIVYDTDGTVKCECCPFESYWSLCSSQVACPTKDTLQVARDIVKAQRL